MRVSRFLAGLVLGVGVAGAQQQRSTDDASAWYGVMVTPVGAFPTMEMGPGVALRASRWKDPAGEVAQNSFGLAYRPRSASSIQYDLTVGWVQPDDDTPIKDGTGIIGGSAAAPIWQSGAFGIGWKFNVGLGHSTANGGSEYWSLVGQLPVSWTLAMPNKSSVSAFASAGYGVAGVGDFADAEQGLRALVSFGGGWTSAGGFGLHVATQQVMLDLDGVSTPWVTGLSLSLPIGR